MEKAFHILRERNDRLGANFIYKLRQILFCDLAGINVYRPESQKYQDSLFFYPIIRAVAPIYPGLQLAEVLDLREYICDYRKNFGMVINNHWCNLSLTLLHVGKTDIVSQFRRNYRTPYLAEIQSHPKYFDPWSGKKVICVHLRLGDVSHHEKYSGEEEIKEMIEAVNHNRIKIDKYRGQAPIADKVILDLVGELIEQYPDHEVHFVAAPDGPYDFDYPIHRNADPDIDLLRLMHSDILVLSRSSFSMLGGFFHLGSQVYCPRWATAIQSGIDTRYDQSGWISFKT